MDVSCPQLGEKRTSFSPLISLESEPGKSNNVKLTSSLPISSRQSTVQRLGSELGFGLLAER